MVVVAEAAASGGEVVGQAVERAVVGTAAEEEPTR